jgi:hypothetical protein
MAHGRQIVIPLVMSAALVLGGAGLAAAAPATPPAGRVVQQIASVEGVTPQVLRQDLQQGQTLLQIANGTYADANTLATALLAPVKTKLDAAVSAGKITAAREELAYTTLLARTTVLVVTPHPLPAIRRALAGRLHAGWNRLVQEVAGACTTTPGALTKILRAGGTSVLAACQTTNAAMTETQLTSVIYAPIKARMDRAVTNGKLTAAQEQDLAATIQQVIGTALTTALPAHS